jgi:hypothetical protein
MLLGNGTNEVHFQDNVESSTVKTQITLKGLQTDALKYLLDFVKGLHLKDV